MRPLPESPPIPEFVEVVLTVDGTGAGSCVVNGLDISGVAGAAWSITSDPKSGPPTMHVAFTGAIDAQMQARVELDEETTEALKALGWTPPTGD